MLEKLQGKYVVVTGASSGIGKVTALKVAQAGGTPILVARGKEKLDELRDLIESRGGTAVVQPCDLSDLEAIDALCETLTAELARHWQWLGEAGRLAARRHSQAQHWLEAGLRDRFGREGLARAGRLALLEGRSPFREAAEIAKRLAKS